MPALAQSSSVILGFFLHSSLGLQFTLDGVLTAGLPQQPLTKH
jgi:hypothetical protein